jgi:hypothetical protein
MCRREQYRLSSCKEALFGAERMQNGELMSMVRAGSTSLDCANKLTALVGDGDWASPRYLQHPCRISVVEPTSPSLAAIC